MTNEEKVAFWGNCGYCGMKPLKVRYGLCLNCGVSVPDPALPVLRELPVNDARGPLADQRDA
jgi:hypothetical protein